MGRAKDALKLIIGRTAELAFPELGREIDETRNTARAPGLKRAILHARLRRAQSRGEIAVIESALAAFWKGDSGDRFHDNYAQERLNLFRERHSGVIDTFAGLFEHSGVHFSRLVEIGCGDGTVLAWCTERLPWIPEVTGLDINATVIERISAEQPPGGRLSFVNAEARDWLMANPRPGTVMLSNGGVLEYFSQDNLDRLLQTLALSPPAAIVLIEPVSPDHDLRGQSESFVFGRESSFSHNHRYRLNKAGFDVVFSEEIQISNVRWMLMIGLIK